MAQQRLAQLAQELQVLGTEECYYNQQPVGPALNDFLEKQRQVLITAGKLERQLTEEIRFNPSSLMNIEYPLEDEFDSIGSLLAGLEEIKNAAVHSIGELPGKMQIFVRLLQSHLTRGRMSEA